jgi:hypothetical protein
MDSDIVQPKTAPAEVVPSSDAPKAPEGGFSDDLLKIPAMQALFAGQPAALSTSLKDFAKRPEAKVIQSHKDELQKAGIGLYRSLAGDLGVLFNQLHIAGQDIVAADKAGRLLEVAPPFDQVNSAVASSGEANPVMNAAVPQGPKTAGIPPIPASPAPASVQNKTATARIKSLSPGSPTSGAAPGAGRILNSIMKPVV